MRMLDQGLFLTIFPCGMSQAGHSAAGQTYAPGDVRTAEAFGQNSATVLARMTEQLEEVL